MAVAGQARFWLEKRCPLLITITYKWVQVQLNGESWWIFVHKSLHYVGNADAGNAKNPLDKAINLILSFRYAYLNDKHSIKLSI